MRKKREKVNSGKIHQKKERIREVNLTLSDHQTGRKVLNLNAKLLPLSIQTTDRQTRGAATIAQIAPPPLKFKHEIFDTTYDFIEKKYECCCQQ